MPSILLLYLFLFPRLTAGAEIELRTQVCHSIYRQSSEIQFSILCPPEDAGQFVYLWLLCRFLNYYEVVVVLLYSHEVIFGD